ncbi:MAG: hypothetical protein H7Y17_04310 [Chlorobia bacterium]|nr:hypothetical protein [Fimbriimonadaceae bacterium]
MRFFQENFIVRVGDKRETVPLQLPKEKPVLSLSFRKNKNYAVWDDRGLTIRVGQVAKSTRLEAIATSPKAFDADELKQNVELIEKKQRTRGATALSGAKRVGNLVFFLARWDEKDGKPWLEALVSLDLTEDSYHPKFLARLSGLTLAEKPIDDRLFILNERMSAVVRKGEQWGLASFDPDASVFDFKEAGRKLESYDPLTSRYGVFVERTDYGSRIGGRIDLQNLNRKNLVEGKGTLRFTDTSDPLIALLSKGNDVRLLNTETGAELDLLSSVAMRRTALGLVVWSPFKAPKRAWLYGMERWTPLAEWVAE